MAMPSGKVEISAIAHLAGTSPRVDSHAASVGSSAYGNERDNLQPLQYMALRGPPAARAAAGGATGAPQGRSTLAQQAQNCPPAIDLKI